MGELRKERGSLMKSGSAPKIRARGARRWNAVTALEISGGLLRVARASAGGKITDCLTLSLPVAEVDLDDPKVLGEAIADALSAVGVSPGPVVMGAPRERVLLKTLDVPPLPDERELASLIHYQIARDLPFPLAEAVVDFRVTRRKSVTAGDDSGAGQKESFEVVVAAVKRDSVDRFREIARAARLNLVALGWMGYANFRCLQACGHTDDENAVALVSVKPNLINVDVIAHESVLFSRGDSMRPAVEMSADLVIGETENFNRDPDMAVSDEIDDPEVFARTAAVNVARSLHAFAGAGQGISVGRIVIAGATGCEWAVMDLLSEQTDIPCVFLDPATTLGLPRERRQAAAGSVSVIGLAHGACSPNGLAFDFLNPKKPAVPRDLGRVKALAGIVAALAVLLTLFGVRASMLRKREETHSLLLQQVAEEKSRQKIYRAGRIQAKTVADWRKEGSDWLDHYALLSATLPSNKEIYLTSFSVGRSGTIRLGVQARTGNAIAKLDARLRAAGYDVRPIAISPGSDRHGYVFRSSVELYAPSGMKIDLTTPKPPTSPANGAEPLPVKGGAG